MSDKMGIIISVENYQSKDHGLSRVKYATSDSDAIKKIFIEKFGIDNDDIYVFKDDQFTKTTAENDI